MKPLVIGICGGSGSGKTTVAKRLIEAFPEEAVLLSMDFYYRRHDELTYEQRCRINYDHPDSLEIPLMIEHLKALKAGEKVTVPQYDFTVHNRSGEVLELESRPIIIVEGIESQFVTHSIIPNYEFSKQQSFGVNCHYLSIHG